MRISSRSACCGLSGREHIHLRRRGAGLRLQAPVRLAVGLSGVNGIGAHSEGILGGISLQSGNILVRG